MYVPKKPGLESGYSAPDLIPDSLATEYNAGGKRRDFAPSQSRRPARKLGPKHSVMTETSTALCQNTLRIDSTNVAANQSREADSANPQTTCTDYHCGDQRPGVHQDRQRHRAGEFHAEQPHCSD